MSDSEQCSNRLEFGLISPLVNYSYELGQIMARFDFLWPRRVIVSNHVQTDFQLCIIDHVLLDSGALRPKGLLFHVVFCSSVCCFIAMYVSISLLRNVEGGDPSPYASKKQRSVAPAFLS